MTFAIYLLSILAILIFFLIGIAIGYNLSPNQQTKNAVKELKKAIKPTPKAVGVKPITAAKLRIKNTPEGKAEEAVAQTLRDMGALP